MKIPIITNLYPAHYWGKEYAIHCAQVAGTLQGTGREVRALTSIYGMPQTSAGLSIWLGDNEVTGASVHRRLHEYY